MTVIGATTIDDQPVAAGFFDEGKWISEYITPESPDIIMLHEKITKGLYSLWDKAIADWDWVANQVKYKSFISASINVEGRSFSQGDYWQTPAMCSKTHIGNCVNKAFLLTSLMRRDFPADKVYCVLGNLYNGHASGHAWVEASINGETYILESTRNDVPLVPVDRARRYEPVHYLNDKEMMAVPGKTVLTPFEACYSSWLKDYLHWTYINGGH